MKTPNIMTLTRILISPFFIFFFVMDRPWSVLVCIVLAAVIETSDFLDGKIARKYAQISDFGKLMDPFADSISRFTIFLCFLSAGLAPVWLIAIFFYRDTLVTVVRLFSIKRGVVVAARQSGKTKAWVQAVSIFLVLFILLFQKFSLLPSFLTPPNHVLYTTIIIAVAASVTLWSAFDYWMANKSIVIKAMKVDK
ncbi:CDP-diacylglycerol--glycerol-3-phosphate 3-phosphatidyltransferase [candidate division KSB1 bacterium RBG_16_48_16]|nr:MAG: CDP-diacylglycerol--glycerol-3-phosphate 3-phosphatidyltransferase [candidate division KSB1 bacterium RBG_16_48_16]